MTNALLLPKDQWQQFAGVTFKGYFKDNGAAALTHF
jgi:hypothetical protein